MMSFEVFLASSKEKQTKLAELSQMEGCTNKLIREPPTP